LHSKLLVCLKVKGILLDPERSEILLAEPIARILHLICSDERQDVFVPSLQNTHRPQNETAGQHTDRSMQFTSASIGFNHVACFLNCLEKNVSGQEIRLLFMKEA